MGASSVREKAILYVGGKRVGGGAISGGNVLLNAGQHALGGPEHTGQLPADRVSFVPAAGIASTDVQGAIEEDAGDLAAHLADTIDAHDASATSFVPYSTLAATNVQAAIQEMLDEMGGGGKYPASPISIRYTFSTTTTDADPGAGLMRLSNASQYLAVTVRADLLDVDGADVTALLDAIDDGGPNTVLGWLRLQHETDATKWLVATVSAIASPSGYRNVTIANIAKSANSPFANADPVVLSFLPVLTNPATTSQDLLVAGANGVLGRLGKGSDDQVLTVDPSTHLLSWATPSGGGGGGSGALVLLEQHTASASTQLDFTSFISSTYDDYLFELVDLVMSTGNQLYMRCSVAGAFDSGANYEFSHFVYSYLGSAVGGGSSQTVIQVYPYSGRAFNTTSGKSVPGFLKLIAPGGSNQKRIYGQMLGGDNVTAAGQGLYVNALYLSASAVDGVRFLASSGNIASGVIRVYGLTK